jgi:hypothetical protein
MVRISKGRFDPASAAQAERLLGESEREMLAQRPILEAAGVTFEVIINHETLWTITP